MIGFFLAAALLLALALYFVIPPLIGKRGHAGDVSHDATNLTIYRDQLRELESDLANGTLDKSQYDAAKLEIERRVLDEVEEDAERVAQTGGPHWTIAGSVAVLIPLLAIPLYIALGTPEALDSAKRESMSAQGGHELTPERIAAMAAQLKQKLSANPDDPEGWVMLAKTSQAIGRHDDAVTAYRELIKRVPPDAQLYADFADTLAMANGRSLAGEPSRLIEQALALDGKNVKALALGGTVAYQNQDFGRAVTLWRQILAIVPPDQEFHQRILQSVTEAESRLGAKPASAQKAVVEGGGRISGKVSLDSVVAKAVAPDDVVFVFARAANGPKMPLAIKRLSVRDLPLKFELTDAMAMAPGMSISQFGDLLVGARVSKSGNAVAQPGDWESELVPAKVGTEGVTLVIARIVR